MNVWRLIAHHDHPASEAEYYRRESLIAVGWGGTSDLNQCSFRDMEELKKLITIGHPQSSPSNCANGAHSLWHLYNDVQQGDLIVVVADGKKVATMQVTGDYYFVGDEGPQHYEHRCRAKAIPIDANRLWRTSGGAAPGEGVYSALIRCARPIEEAEFNALIG